MKLKDLKNIFSQYTNVKLVINGKDSVYEGYWCNVPVEYSNYSIHRIIPIKHPSNVYIGEASILIYQDYED